MEAAYSRKVLVFTWKMCHGILLTRSLLFQRHILVLVECLFNHREEETNFHVMLKCNYTKAIWFGSPLTIKLDNIQPPSIKDWLKVYIDDSTSQSQSQVQITWFIIIILAYEKQGDFLKLKI